MSTDATASLINQISFNKKKHKQIFLDLPEAERAYILLQLSKYIQTKIVSAINNNELIKTIEHLDPDEATDIIQLLPPHRQKKIIQGINKKLQDNIEILNQFDPQTAAGIMSLNYIQVDINDTIESIAKQFKTHENRTGHLPAIFITAKGTIIGSLPVHNLGFAKPSDKAQKYVKNIHTIKHNASQATVIATFRKHPHQKVAVVGEHNNLLGVIYSDDVLKALQEQENTSLYDFAGVQEEEHVTDSSFRKVKHRYKWLILNLGTAFLAALTISFFEETISKFVLLAVYMPIVAGMGGNAGTQTLVVLVRGITLKQIELKNALPFLKKEVIAGIINGLINGIIVAAIVMIFNQDLKVALVLGMAMIINLVVAGFFGTLIPLTMKAIGKDPATSATIFITTATDVLGFLAFLGLATLVLN